MDEYLRPSDRLAQVDTAIEAVLAGGQSYRLGSQSVTRADLSQLRALRDELAAAAVKYFPTNLEKPLDVGIYPRYNGYIPNERRPTGWEPRLSGRTHERLWRLTCATSLTRTRRRRPTPRKKLKKLSGCMLPQRTRSDKEEGAGETGPL